MDPSMVTTALELPGAKIVRNLGVVRGIVVRSRSVLGTLGASLGALAYALRIRRRIVNANLALAFPEKSADERATLAAANYRHAGRSGGREEAGSLQGSG